MSSWEASCPLQNGNIADESEAELIGAGFESKEPRQSGYSWVYILSGAMITPEGCCRHSLEHLASHKAWDTQQDPVHTNQLLNITGSGDPMEGFFEQFPLLLSLKMGERGVSIADSDRLKSYLSYWWPTLEERSETPRWYRSNLISGGSDPCHASDTNLGHRLLKIK